MKKKIEKYISEHILNNAPVIVSKINIMDMQGQKTDSKLKSLKLPKYQGSILIFPFNKPISRFEH